MCLKRLQNNKVYKTTLGMHFVGAAPPDEKVVLCGFYETPPRYLFKAKKLGLDLEKRMKKGALEMLWQPSTEQNVDELVQNLLHRVVSTSASRVLIDGLDGLHRATFHSERVHHIFTALANELRAQNVTTLYTYEVPKLIGPDLEAPISGVSALVENLLYLRFVELDATLHRVLSILKVRDVSYDPRLRSFQIGPNGIELTPLKPTRAGRKARPRSRR